MALDFGNGVFRSYFKYDASTGFCKYKASKEDEPRISPPISMAADMYNARLLHLCFPSNSPPQRLYFSDTIGKDDGPPPIGQHKFKVGFDLMIYVINKYKDEMIGVLPWIAHSNGAQQSFNLMHDIWLKGKGPKRPQEVPVFACAGSEKKPVGTSYQTEVMIISLIKWSKRDEIPGLNSANETREESNIAPEDSAFSDRESVDAFSEPIQDSNDIFGSKAEVDVEVVEEENQESDLPF